MNMLEAKVKTLSSESDIRQIDPYVDWVMVLTLAIYLAKTLILAPIWPLLLATELLCFVGLMFPKFRCLAKFWLALAAVLGLTLFIHWETADNHRYLFCYWSIALGMVASVPVIQQRRAIQINGALLIGLCMGFATYWKAVNADYVDDSFFQYILLTDERFDFFTAGLTGVSNSDLAENRRLENLMKVGYLRNLAVPQSTLAASPHIEALAKFMTWWTVLIEGTLAVLFVLPGTRLISAIRNVLLVGFAATTYAVATVIGFAWILLLMGIAQCREEEKKIQVAYLVVFLMVVAFKEIPFGILVNATGLLGLM